MASGNKPKTILQSPKGMRDILSEDYAFYQNIFDLSEEISSYYGFQPIQTPHLEKTELFTASLGETTDIVEKEMYSLKTKGGDKLTLRPEGTAPILRAYIEHGMHTLPQPVMLWYKGSYFRHEKPQKGRFREFQQFGLEIIGEQKPIAEATIIKILTSIFNELGIGPVVVHINSLGDKDCRASYRKELLAYYRKHGKNLCKDCKRRIKENPLRLLDCKEPGCAELKQKAPQMIDYLCNPCKQHLKETLEFLDSNDIAYMFNNQLVRGLDYYTRTVFEIFEENADHNQSFALAAGGRYDCLAKTLGKKEFPAAGGALGVERIMELMREKNITPRQKRAPKIFFVQLGSTAKYKSLEIIDMFRKARVPLAQSISKDNIRGQLKLASRLKVAYALILGQKEALENSIIIRNMDTGAQETAPMEKVVEIVKKKLTNNK